MRSKGLIPKFSTNNGVPHGSWGDVQIVVRECRMYTWDTRFANGGGRFGKSFEEVVYIIHKRNLTNKKKDKVRTSIDAWLRPDQSSYMNWLWSYEVLTPLTVRLPLKVHPALMGLE